MKLRKFRRYYLDVILSETEFKGRVLDIGGKKIKSRGDFSPPVEKVDSWQYLNIDASTEPDYLCPADNIPVENNYFDTILMTEVLEHLKNTESVLKELYRVLKNGGSLIASIPFLSAIHMHTNDFQRWTGRKIQMEFEKAGFHVEKIESMGGIFAVVTDMALTYTGNNPTFINKKLIEKIIRLSLPLFLCLDKRAKSKDRITTGFFIRARKNKT